MFSLSFPFSVQASSKKMAATYGFYVIILLVFGAAREARGSCTAAPPTKSGMTPKEVVAGEMLAYTCDGSKEFKTGDSAIIIYCVDGSWQEITVECGTNTISDCSEASPDIEGAEKRDIIQGVLTAYSCKANDQAWLSGEPQRVSQCRKGSWVPVMDICDEVCNVPRDCFEVQQLGFTTSSYYIVIPTGRALDSSVKVYCELSSTDTEGGHWTRILFNSGSDMTDSGDLYDVTGILDEETMDLFLALRHMNAITLNLDGSFRPHVLEVILYVGDVRYFAAYDNFTVGGEGENYAIASLGTYHGNAGDALCPHVHMAFAKDDNNIGWWGDVASRDVLMVEEKGCLLTNSSMLWLPLADVGSVTNVTMRIRPLEYDNTVTCPPMVGWEPYWTTTNGSWPLERNASSIITWNCIGEMMVEPTTMADKGAIECIDTQGTLAWNDTIKLPCRMHCPDGFNASYDEKRCYHFAPADAAVDGLHQAAVKCMEQNASVAVLQDGKDLYQAEAGVRYYTAHTGLGRSAAWPPVPLNDSLLNCTDGADCDLLGDNNCLTIQSDGSATPVRCNETFSYACQLPVVCPEGYVRGGGGCYLFVEEAPLPLTEGEKRCNEEGGSLAYPNSPAALAQMGGALKDFRAATESTSEAPLLVGVNSRLGDFTAGSLYPDATQLELEVVADQPYHQLQTADPYQLAAVAGVEVAAVSSDGAVCQWPGVVGCYFAPPAPLANMSTDGTDPVNYTRVDFLDVITYRCTPGYFVGGNISLTAEQNLTCLGALGSWQPALLACERVAVCEDQYPEVTTAGVTNETDADTPYPGGRVTYTCPEGLALPNASVAVNQTLTCGEDPAAPGTFGFFPPFQDCLACLGEPSAGNTTSDYDEATVYVYNTTLGGEGTKDHVTLTCEKGYEAAFNVTEQRVHCTYTSWNMTGILPCQMACTDMPPEGGQNMTAGAVGERWLGAQVTYSCNPGTYLESNGTLAIESTTTATCEGGVWLTQRGREDLNCYLLAIEDPQVPPEGVNYTWVGDGSDNRREGAVVTYTCPEGKLFINRTSTLNSTSVNGTWTPIESLVCNTACLDDPPAEINGAPSTWSGQVSWVDDVVTYSCPEGQATDYGAFNESITCADTGVYEPVDQELNMTTLQEVFVCEPACPGPPVEHPAGGDWSYVGNFTEGTVVEYWCVGGATFVGGAAVLQSNCTDGNWTLSVLPECDMTTASPTTESTVIETPSPPYAETADTHYSIIQNNMTDTDGINATYTATDAPFGFGYAVLIESAKKQCLRQIDFPADSGTACMSDPNKCMKKGLSFCIWERHTFSQDEFVRSGKDQLKESDIKYVLSTGGDMKGHPGIAFYHYGVFQHVVVSTGAEYWHVRVPGLMANGTWANVGIRWHPNVTKDDNGEPMSGGLELFINKKLEGRSFWPQTASDGAKPNLNPNEMMLGCHRTNDSSEYRYFGDGEYDEIASWKRALADNETDYFLGGYMENFSQLTPQQMSEKLASIDMNNPEMVSNALGAMVQMTTKHDRPTGSPEPTSAETASLASSSPTPAGPNSLNALEQAESLQKREDLLDLTEKLLVEESVPETLTYAQGDKYLAGLEVVSNLMSPDSASEWKTIQANGSAGSASLMSNSVKFARKAFCNIKYNNNTKPFTIVKGFDNIIFYGQKMLYEDLKARGKYVQMPDYGHETLKPYKTKWNQIFDMGRVLTNVLNDDHCDKRPVCLVTLVFDTYDDIGPCPVNIAYIPSDREHEMGARLLYGSLTSDKARDASGKVNSSAPLCNLDQFTMSRNPFYTKLENRVRVPAVRQLRFHADEVATKVSTRRCAYWNEKLSDFGAWDTDGCSVVDSTSEYTKCTCEKFGSMIVLDEKVKDPEIPPEPSWLHIVKLVLYIISAVLLVFYCIVVGYSSDLKEQFHLMGMYLSISVLIGSISMVVSDLDAIRSDRHLCTTLSTITHYFYLAAGVWVACLGHASFKAITSGEVGGKLNSYSCIAWGVAMFSVGIPYAFFVRDLGTDPRCFVTWENNGKAAFFLPQVACVCIAFFFGVVVLFNLSTPALRKENLVEDYGSFCRGAAFVMLYFAITWTFGLLAYMRFGLSVDFYPLFQVFNSAMGIIIFIFIGIASYRYRTVLVGKAKTRHEKIKNLAGIKKTKLEEEQPSPKRAHPDKTPERPATQASMNRPPSSGQKAPERPATQASLHPPPSRGQVAGRPGSRPVTPIQ